jgi:hypothetical protein
LQISTKTSNEDLINQDKPWLWKTKGIIFHGDAHLDLFTYGRASKLLEIYTSWLEKNINQNE